MLASTATPAPAAEGKKKIKYILLGTTWDTGARLII